MFSKEHLPRPAFTTHATRVSCKRAVRRKKLGVWQCNYAGYFSRTLPPRPDFAEQMPFRDREGIPLFPDIHTAAGGISGTIIPRSLIIASRVAFVAKRYRASGLRDASRPCVCVHACRFSRFHRDKDPLDVCIHPQAFPRNKY